MSELQAQANTTKYERRWKTLAVLSLSLVVIGLDNTVLNVALPALQTDLDASSSTLQWIVDSYLLVFAGLLLAFGTFGDRHGRKRAMNIGLVVFGSASVAAAFAETGNQLIAARAAMGAGAALIMPATLSIITDVFPREERGKAIAVWAGMAAIGVGLGPLIGGALLEASSWPAVFWLNVPVVGAALLLGARLVPESRDPEPGRLDMPGVVLSVAGLTSLVYGIIEAPERGWTDGLTLALFGAAVALGIAFVQRQRTAANPLLDVSLFRKPSFSVGSLAISAAFFALFGAIFALTQFLQFVQGDGPLEAGAKMTPIALGLVIGSQLSERVAAKVGTARVVATGLIVLSAMLVSTLGWDPGIATGWLLGFFFVLALSMGLIMAPATASVMNSVPEAKAGVGSATNDVNRMVAGALGVAVIGSVMNSIYSSKVADAVAGLPAPARADAEDSVGAAVSIGSQIEGSAGEAIRTAAASGFTDAMGLAFLVAAGIAAAAAVAVIRLLPDTEHEHATEPEEAPQTLEPERQAA